MPDQASPGARPLSGMRVLLAEDSWHLATAMRQILEHAGAEIAGLASTLARAEQLSRTASFDTAVLDLNLHDELTTPLVTRLAAGGTKVVVISGYDFTPELVAAVHACLGKPVLADDLIKTLQLPLRRA